MLIAAGRGPARLPTCEHTLRHVQTRVYHLIGASDEVWFMADRLRHDLRFDEWQDDHDARTRRLSGMGFRTVRVDDFSPLLLRALSLFGSGELRALHVPDIDVFRLVKSPLLLPREASAGGARPQIGQAVDDALCSVHVAEYLTPFHDLSSLAALLKRRASTITELDVKFASSLPPGIVEQVSSALACCVRLVSLSDVSRLAPATWLGLSQLHTLRGVDLGDVSFATIAAALPRLHTLTTCGYCNDAAQAANFFTDLLPRLRVFRFTGKWPDLQEQQPVSSTVAPLPLLQELVWADAWNIAPRGFLGAQPTSAHVSRALISQCWLGGAVDAAANFLTRMCDLHINATLAADRLDLADVARILRAAPQLKKFHTADFVHGGASWLAPTLPTHPAFEGLVHPRLRELGIRTPCVATSGTSEANPPDAEWVAHLRRRHFPRLRELVAGKDACFVTPAPYSSSETGTTS
jgi:hypothetical protein